MKKKVLGFSNLAHFYTILDTFIRSYTLPYDPEHSYTILSQPFLTHNNFY